MNNAALVDLSFFLIVLYMSLFCSMILVPVAKKMALATGLLDHPDSRKVHNRALPSLGGLGIAGATLLTVVLCVSLSPQVVAYLSGAAIVIFIGLLDDIVLVPPPMKFSGQILAALVFVLLGGGELTTLGNLFGLGEISLGAFSLVFSVVAIAGVINAINLADGLDGLAGGVSSIALVFLGLLAYTQQAWFTLVIVLAVLGAVLGFLRHNSHPAKLFMGDTGSLFLGFTLAVLAVRLSVPAVGLGPVNPVVFAVILALPIYDTIWVMVTRLRDGKKPYHPDNTHLHHRFMRLGLKHGDTVTVIYGLMFFFGVLGWLGREWPEWLLFAWAMIALAALYAGISWCERRRINLGRKWTITPKQSTTKNGAKKRLIRTMGRSSQYVLPVFLFFLFVPLVVTVPPHRPFGFFALTVTLFIILLYPWSGGRRRMPLAHGILFVATFAVVLGLWAGKSPSPWLFIYGNILSGFAVLWIVPQILWGRAGRSILPMGFELMLIVLVWFVPLIFAPAVGIQGEQQGQLAWACIQAMPIIVLIKILVKRHARHNRMLAAAFVILLAGVGITSFL